MEEQVKKEEVIMQVQDMNLENSKEIDVASDGNVEFAKSNEAMVVAEMNQDSENDDFFPSFFIEDDDRHIIKVDCLFDKKTKRVTSVSRHGLDIDFTKYKYLKHRLESFAFSVPDYEAVSKYRQRSIVKRDGSEVVVDGVQLRNHLIIWHLKDWSLCDKNGEKVELTFEENGALTDESIKKVYSLPNAVLDVVLTIFERDVLLSE